jgi:ketosteroid isomerase-like protein
MKNKITNGIAVSIIALLMMACQPKKEEVVLLEKDAVDTEQIKAEIQAMEDRYAEGMNNNTTDDVVYYADDAVSYGQDEPPKVGKAAIHKKMKEDAADAKANNEKIAFITNDIHVSSDGEQVVELGSYKLTTPTNTVLRSGNYMAVFKKIAGKYVCVRDMGVSDAP